MIQSFYYSKVKFYHIWMIGPDNTTAMIVYFLRIGLRVFITSRLNRLLKLGSLLVLLNLISINFSILAGSILDIGLKWWWNLRWKL